MAEGSLAPLFTSRFAWVAAAIFMLGAAGCGSSSGGGASSGGNNSTSIEIDGSSTVAPITKADAEAFRPQAPNVRISIAESGTAAGMKRFVSGELPICDASRPITDEELVQARDVGIDVVEIPIAYDGMTIVVNKKNDFVKSITLSQLKRLWEAGSSVNSWKDLDPSWPDRPIKLFGPTSAHGSFEYFTEVVLKNKNSCRTDYEQCSDYAAVAQGVGQDDNGLGYLGLSYFEQNKDSLNAVAVDSGKGPVLASKDTILNDTYSPLSRVLAIYTTKAALTNPQIKSFLKFVVSGEGQKLIESSEVGYVDLPASVYAAAASRIEKGTTGSVLAKAARGVKIEELFH
jgi:phosphate transport system substrate-binding protein